MVDLTAIVGVISVFGSGFLIVAVVMWVEYKKSLMKSQERLAAIEKGILPAGIGQTSEPGAAPRPLSARKYRGIVTLFVGIGLAVALYVSVGAEASVWGLFVAFIAVGQLVHGFIAYRDVPKDGSSAS